MEEVLTNKYEPSYFYSHQNTLVARSSPSFQPHKSSSFILPFRHDTKDTKDKNIKSNNKDKSIKRDFLKLSAIIKCYNCQDNGYVAANYPSTFKIAITNKVFIEVPKHDSTISPKVTPVIKELVLFSRLYCQHHLLHLLYY